MKKEILLPEEERLIGSVESATQALERARRSFQSIKIATADSLDKRAGKIQAVFAQGLDFEDPLNGKSSDALEEVLQRSAQRQAAIGEILSHGLHEMAVREIVEAINMVPHGSCFRKESSSGKDNRRKD